MPGFGEKIRPARSLEELSAGSSVIHRVHPAAKILSTLIFVLLTVSWPSYETTRLAPFVFYPALLMPLSETPWGIVLKRAALALPFCLAVGLSNIIFMPQTAFYIGRAAVSYGTLSCLTLLFRAFLCVSAVLILTATTPLTALSRGLLFLRAPKLFVSLLEMTYRYIGTLFDEAASMYASYLLRSPGRRGLKIAHMGSFIGYLLIRSADRAQRVYNAMLCRGYGLPQTERKTAAPAAADWAYLAAAALPFLFFRLFNIYNLLGGMLP